MSRNSSRRDFLKHSLQGLAVATIPGAHALAQSGYRQRLDWDTFKRGRDYSSFVDAIAKMRANTDPSDKRSWQYWTNVHLSFCPHEVAYFLAWHRGYLYYFEQQLRALSGNRALTLPYWDYYRNPVVPAEFTNPASWNPLYVPRINTDVSAALTLAPFADNVTNMQRGLVDAFESTMESMPHNPVHNIIGGVMASLNSPSDPIFWLHHANVDRLFSAWVAAGNGRIMPARTDPYWNGNFTYATRLALPRRNTVDTRLDMGYFYQNETMPTLPTPIAALAPDQTTQAATRESTTTPKPSISNGAASPIIPPPVGQFKATRKRLLSPKRLSLGGASELALNENSVSARVMLDPSGSQTLQSIIKKTGASPFLLPGDSVDPTYTSVQVTLDDVKIVGNGKDGGFFYNVYLQLPSEPSAIGNGEKYMLGNIGPFQIDGAKHHDSGSAGSGVRLVLPATQLVKRLSLKDISALTISFVRVSGKIAPLGNVITIGECRVEVSSDDVQ